MQLFEAQVCGATHGIAHFFFSKLIFVMEIRVKVVGLFSSFLSF